MKIIATTFTGLEGVLKNEIERLGGRNITVLKRAVSFFGDKELLYRSNLVLRTAIRVLLPVTDFFASDPDTLYEKIFEIEWPALFDKEKTFAVDAVVHSNIFRHSGFVAQKVKDAIADKFRERFGFRPDVDKKQPNVLINIHVQNDYFTVSLDSSGEPLYKRGYRVEQTIAPMNEALAAGLIQLSGWDARTDFVDFMCGSGTLPIEAALLATNTPSQFKRTYFGFKHWKNYDKGLWDKVKKEEIDKINKDIKIKIWGSDKSSHAIDIAWKNAISAKVEEVVDFRDIAMERLRVAKHPKHIIINPPYGRRLSGNMRSIYQSIGRVLKEKFPGSKAWIFTTEKKYLYHIGLKPSKTFTIKTGAVEGIFNMYEIF